MRVRTHSHAIGLFLGLISASLVSSQVWHLVFDVILHRALHMASKAILAWQVVSRKSVFTDRTRELARRAAGDAGDFYGRSKTYIHAVAPQH